jgi:alkylation response protein AidB-like acyl-CoA dehydrogenase
LLQAGRAWFYNVNDEIWRRGLAGDGFTVEDRATARLASVTATKLALQAIDLVADAAGMNANQTTSPISRCWPDAHAVT